MGKSKSAYLAIDMGAESARAIVGHLENGVIKTEEIHRWPSRNISVQGVQYWDVLYIFDEVKTAIKKFVQLYGNIPGVWITGFSVNQVSSFKTRCSIATIALTACWKSAGKSCLPRKSIERPVSRFSPSIPSFNCGLSRT